MSPSISIVLPLHNAEGDLARVVARLLEFLPELSPRFEVVLVDDASTDHTEEIARELAREFPQVRWVRHSIPRGTAAAVATGLEEALGEFLFVQRQGAPLAEHEIRRLWAQRAERNMVLARATPAPLDAGLIERLMAWGTHVQQAAASTGDVQLIRREALEHLRQLSTAYDPPGIPSAPRDEIATPPAGESRGRAPRVKEGSLRRPNFLARVKNFALGE